MIGTEGSGRGGPVVVPLGILPKGESAAPSQARRDANEGDQQGIVAANGRTSKQRANASHTGNPKLFFYGS
jgi:hypothetical protein